MAHFSNENLGGVVEWLMAPVLKTGRAQALVGSNPTPSAGFGRGLVISQSQNCGLLIKGNNALEVRSTHRVGQRFLVAELSIRQAGMPALQWNPIQLLIAD